MVRFIELHYQSGDAFIVNVGAISRVYVRKEDKATVIALLEDKNSLDKPTECSRRACYPIKESYNQVQKLLVNVTSIGGEV